jgi:hypothetical protein
MGFCDDIILHFEDPHTGKKSKKWEVKKRCQHFTMFTLRKAKKAHRGGTGIALLSL